MLCVSLSVWLSALPTFPFIQAEFTTVELPAAEMLCLCVSDIQIQSLIFPALRHS